MKEPWPGAGKELMADLPLPWTYSKEDGCLIAANGQLINGGLDYADFDAAKRREAACVNALQGMPTKALVDAADIDDIGRRLLFLQSFMAMHEEPRATASDAGESR